jgi:hypothetical protein
VKLASTGHTLRHESDGAERVLPVASAPDLPVNGWLAAGVNLSSTTSTTIDALAVCAS